MGVRSIGILSRPAAVSYTHLRAHETVLDLVCRLLLEKKQDTKIRALLYAKMRATIHRADNVRGSSVRDYDPEKCTDHI